MNIKNIYNQTYITNRKPQNFGSLYIDDRSTYDLMRKYANDKRTCDKFIKAFTELNEAAQTQDIQISQLDKGICVSKVNGATEALYEIIALDTKDFLVGLGEAAKNLKRNN